MNLDQTRCRRTVSEPELIVFPDVPRDMVSKFRIGAPKVRTGCITCKIRRIKCDEGKPSCQKCLSTGRKCDGYNPPKMPTPTKPKRPKKPPAVPVLALVERSFSASAATYIPSVDIQASMNERRSFHYFLSRNLSSMTSNFEPYFWGILLPQFSHSYPTVRKSLVALSTIYEKHENGGRLLANSHLTNEYVLHQYTKAIKCLIDYLDLKTRDPQVALVSCLIFVLIEFLQKNLVSGFQHLNGGLKILHQVRGLGSLVISPMDDQCNKDSIYGSLTRSFTRLRAQAAIHGSILGGAITPLEREAEALGTIPSSFSSIFESRIYLDNEFNAIFGYMRRLRDQNRHSSFGDIDEKSIAAIQKTHLRRLEQWKGATEALKRVLVGQDDTPLAPSFSYLIVYYTLLSVLLMALLGDEMSFDEHIPKFEQILVLSDELIQNRHNEKPPTVSFDMGIIPPLFFVLLKCRSLGLRLKALELLRLAPKQEGMWFRDSILKICEWKIAMEESGRGDLPLDALLPKSARIYQEHVGNDKKCIGSTMVCLRYRKGHPHPNYLESVWLPADLEMVEAMGNML